MAGLMDDPSLRSRRAMTTSVGAARREHHKVEDFAMLCRSLSDHVLRRRQTGRIDALPQIVEDPNLDGDHLLTRSADLHRQRVIQLDRRIGHTDRVIAEWLTAHRAPEGDSDGASENSVSAGPWGDPILRLIWHIQDVVKNVQSRGGIDDSTLRRLDAQLTKPFDALRSEVAAAEACASASIQYASAAVKAALT